MPRPPRILLAGRTVSATPFQAAYSTVVNAPLESTLPSVSQHIADSDAKAYKPEQNLEHGLDASSVYESTRIGARRKGKAGRDKRMDVTAMLTPVKTHMGSFARSSTLRPSNLDAGRSLRRFNKSSLTPSPAAYTPHTVFLLESRYPVSYGVGRTDSVHHIFGVCPAGLLPDVLKKYNSPEAPAEVIEHMDNARWPWNAQQKMKMTKWWANKKEWLQRMREIEGNQDLRDDDFSTLEYNAEVSPVQEVIDDINGNQGEIKSFPPSPATRHARKQTDDYNPSPERRLKQTTGVKEAHAESTIDLFGGGMTRFKAKVPFEVPTADGKGYEHPSGFPIPTPAHHFADNLPPSRAPHVSRDDIPQNNDSQIDIESWNAMKKKDGQEGLMSGLTGSFEVDIVARQEKIPTEIHGDNMVHQHASGFTPPTPLMHRGEGEALSHRVSEIEEQTLTQIAGRDDLDDSPHSNKQVQRIPIRAQYMPHVAETPFWRPVVSFTVSTRPLALTLVRLSKGLARGTPYHTMMDNIEKKERMSQGLRNRNLRLNRMEELVRGLSEALAGERGAIPGVRFSTGQRGHGEDDRVPFSKRVVGVGIGSWYHRKHELVETYQLMGEDLVTGTAETSTQNPMVLYELDEYGRVMGSRSVTDPLPEDYVRPSDYATSPPPAAFVEISRMRRLLERVGGNARSLYVVAPKDGLKKLDKVTDIEKSIIRVFYPVTTLAEAAEIQARDDEIVIHGGNAVHFLKQRMEQLSDNFKEDITAFRAARSTKVMYPQKSALDNELKQEDHEDKVVEKTSKTDA